MPRAWYQGRTRRYREAARNSPAGEGESGESLREGARGRKGLVRAASSKRGEKLDCYRLNGFAVGCNKLRENEVTADTGRPEVNCCLRTPQAPIQPLSKQHEHCKLLCGHLMDMMHDF